jgi:3-deoxy-D-manno-octulosonic acid kinase
VFDETRLAEQNLITGQAGAGRGNTFFLHLENHALVLRHYRRGGLARKLSSQRYVFTGLYRTRAMREFDILEKMYNMQLPVPKPFACRVENFKVTYEASIVTHQLPGNTLAHQLESTTISDEHWKNIGTTIARFHKAGVYHADLNAHNIMLTDEGKVYLIDFDRAAFRPISANPASETWCLSNLDRLKRSLKKEAKQRDGALTQKKSLGYSEIPGFEILKSSWNNSLS